VKDAKTNELLFGAKVIVKGQAGVGALSDIDGNYLIQNVKPGSISLEVRFETYKTQVIPLFELKAGENKVLNVDLEKLVVGKAPTAADKARAQAEAEKLIAQGWSAVVEVPTDMVPAQLRQLKENDLFAELTKPVAGGRIFTTTLINVFFADNGRIFAGSVTQQRLLEVAKK
jgi:hypothetical protein